MKFKLTGLDKFKKQLKDLSSKPSMEKMIADEICKKVPEAKAYRNQFKFTWHGDRAMLDQKGIPAEIYTKIENALA